MSDRMPSDILSDHGVCDTRACIRELARFGWGFAPIDVATDLPDLAEGDVEPMPEAGPGKVWIDATRALIVESIHTSLIVGHPEQAVAMLVSGRVNQQTRTVKVLLIVSPNVGAQMIAHLQRFAGLGPMQDGEVRVREWVQAL